MRKLHIVSAFLLICAWPIAVYAGPAAIGAILVSVAFTAAATAASAGLQYLALKNQKVAPVDRGKQDDIRISVPGYGEFIPKGYGIFRVAPIWFWHTPTIHTTVETPGQPGGKGGPRPPSPATIEHIYTKSIAGVFHDGQLFGGVSRIWFDTDLVVNMTDLLLASTRNEAEFGVLAGGASVANQTECSGGKKVTGIGNGGTCTISVDVASGSHVLSVHYTSTVDRTFKISINGGATTDLVCPSSGGAGIVAIQTMNVTFNTGVNTVAFSNSGAACPDLDYIDCVPALVFDGGHDTRSWTGLVDVNKVIPTNRDEPWPYYNVLPQQSSTGVISTNLARWGQPSIRIYKGTETQTTDSAIIADKGAANTSAYRGWAYIVIEGIQLQNGRLPNVTIECYQGVHSLPAIVEDIYSLVGVTNTNLELTALQGLTLGSATIDAGSYSATTFAASQNMSLPGGGAATKNAGAADTWNAYATAASFSSGNKAIRFTAGNGTFLVGFASSATPTTADILFGAIINLFSQDAILGSVGTPNAIQMQISGVQSRDVGHWAVGDTFQIELREGKFRLYQKGFEIFGFSPPVPTFPLFPCVMAFTTGAGVSASSTATSIGDVPASNAGGLIVTSRRSAEEVLGDLQTRFQFDMVEVDGKVKAVLRNGSSDLTIPHEELRAHDAGSEQPRFDAQITDVDPLLLPARMDVNYLDPALDYHNNTQSDMRLTGPQEEQSSVSLSIIDSANNMKALAATLLYKPEIEGREFRISTGPKYMRAHPGTVLTLTLPNATHVMRVIESRYALPAGVCEFIGVRQQGSLYTPNVTGSVPGIEPRIAPIPSNTKGIIIDGPLLRAEDGGDGTEPVVYIAAVGRGAGDWPGGFLYQEFPIGSGNYKFVTAIDRLGGVGVTSGTLASVSDASVWDRTNSLVIKFYSNTVLSSATEQDVLANPSLNLLGIANPSTNDVEYIQFATATAQAATAPFIKQYSISTLLRGRLTTDGNVGIHTSADDVAVVDGNLKPRRMALTDIGRALKFRFVTSGQAVEDAETITQTLRGNSLKPPAPVHIKGGRNAAGDLFISWVRRDRQALFLRDSAGTSLAEEAEVYQLSIMDGSNVKRGPIRIRSQEEQEFIAERTISYDPSAVEEQPIVIGIQRIDHMQALVRCVSSLDGTAVGGEEFGSGCGFINSQASAGNDGSWSAWISAVQDGTTERVQAFVNGLLAGGIDISSYYALNAPIVLKCELVNGSVLFKTTVSGRPEVLVHRATINQGDLSGRDIRPMTITSLTQTVSDARVIPRRASHTYTAAEQTADWGSLKNPCTVRIAQESAIVGPGHAATVSL